MANLANEGLQQDWDSLAGKLGLAEESSRNIYSTLATAYSAPERHYHGIDHLSQMLGDFKKYRRYADNPDWLEIAIWFHDAVYDFGAADNEERSAGLAKKLLKAEGFPELALSRIQEYVLATKHDSPPADYDSQLIADLDLMVLAAPYNQFLEYREKIWQEYKGRYSLEQFKAGTIKFYKGMLDKPNIFHTYLLRERYEEMARSNLEQALAEMRN